MNTTRLEAFSDGVFAIVITLLVLELHAPEPGERTLASALGRMWPSYAAFLASFLVVGIIWLNHHAMFALVSQTTHGLQVANLGLLLTVDSPAVPDCRAGQLRTGRRRRGRPDGRTALRRKQHRDVARVPDHLALHPAAPGTAEKRASTAAGYARGTVGTPSAWPPTRSRP